MFQKLTKNLAIIFLAGLILVSGFDPVALGQSFLNAYNGADGNIVDKIFLAQQNPNVIDNFRTSLHSAGAAEDPDELEYMIDVGPINGDTNANYTYAAFFNPSGSGRTTVIKRIAVRANSVAAANYVNLSTTRITASSGGTEIAAANIPKKNADSSDPVTTVRYAGPTVTQAGVADSRILGQPTAGAAGHYYSIRDITFGTDDEKIILQPGEGISVYQEAAGNANYRIRVLVEWEEVASAPSAQNEFLFAFPRVENAASAGYTYNAFFNPGSSGKTAIVKRVWFGTETCDAAAVYTNIITLNRISASSGGTQISAANVPKKHTGSANSVMTFRRTGVTVTQVGGSDAALGVVTPCGAAGQAHGWQELNFHNADEKLILQEGQGIALRSSATGDIDQITRMIVEWREVDSGSTPASQGEYMFAYPQIAPASAPGTNTTFQTFFNPGGSGKTAVVKRLGIRVNAAATATYSSFNLRRITAASGGVSVAAADLPKKHTGTANSIIEARHCGSTCGTAVSATYAGSTDSRLLAVNGAGAVAQTIGSTEIVFGINEKLILQPGEGVGFYLDVAAGSTGHRIKMFIEWDEETTAPDSENEYLINIGPVNGSTSANYVYGSFFNPGGSGRTAIVKRVTLRIDTQAAANHIAMSLRRTTASSGGTQITAANIPKKHTSTANSAMEIRRTGVTTTLAGTSDSRLTSVHTPNAVDNAVRSSALSYKELIFNNDERIILQPGEGFAIYQEAGGDADYRVKMLVEWEEVASGSTPSSGGEYLMTTGPITGSLDADYVYASLFNPPSSGKNYVVKRIGIRANRSGTITAPGYIPTSLRKVSAASDGTQIAAANIPKKHTGTANTTAEIRHSGVTTTFQGETASRLLTAIVPGVVGQIHGVYESELTYGDELILKPGEGIALYQEATAGDANTRFRFNIQWHEVDLPAITIDISGTCHGYNQTTPCGGETGDPSPAIRVAVNGVLSDSTTAISENWTLSDVSVPEVGDTILTIFIANAAEGDRATSVLKWDGDGDITLVRLYKEHLTIGTDSGSSNSPSTITSADLALFDYVNNSSVFYRVSSDNCNGVTTGSTTVCVDPAAASSQETLRILASNTLALENVILVTHDIEIVGTFTDNGGGNYYITGSWHNTGTYTAGNSPLRFVATASGETITGGASNFGILIFDGVGGGWTVQDNITVTNYLSINNGTLHGSSRTITFTADGATQFQQGSGGTFNMQTSTVQFSGTTVTIPTAVTYKNLTIGGTGTYTLPNSAVNLHGDLTITNNATVVKSTSGKIVFAGNTEQTITDNNSTKQDLGNIQVIGERNMAWQDHSVASAPVFSDVVWSSELGLFVAVASDGSNRVRTSTDGQTWTAHSAAQDNQWQSVTWAPELGLFVAVASSGTNRVMTSSNGIGWSVALASALEAWQSVTWAPELGLFVAVAENCTVCVMTSANGTNWTSRTAAENNDWQSVTWAPELGLFVAVASSGTNRVMTSSNGETWSTAVAAEANPWQSVTWSSNLHQFVAVASSGTNRVMTSSNGTAWDEVAAPGSHAWQSVTWASQQNAYLAVSSTSFMSSHDGLDWNSHSIPAAGDWTALAWSPDLRTAAVMASSGTNRAATGLFNNTRLMLGSDVTITHIVIEVLQSLDLNGSHTLTITGNTEESEGGGELDPITYTHLLTSSHNSTTDHVTDSFSPTAGNRLLAVINFSDDGGCGCDLTNIVHFNDSQNMTWSKITSTTWHPNNEWYNDAIGAWISSPVPASTATTLTIGHNGHSQGTNLSLMELTNTYGSDFAGIVNNNNAPIDGGYTATLTTAPEEGDLVVFARQLTQTTFTASSRLLAMESGWTITTNVNPDFYHGSLGVAMRNDTTSTDIGITDANTGHNDIEYSLNLAFIIRRAAPVTAPVTFGQVLHSDTYADTMEDFTTSSFTVTAGNRLVAVVGLTGESWYDPVKIINHSVITDSQGLTWHKVASVGDNVEHTRGAVVFISSPVQSSGSMTLTYDDVNYFVRHRASIVVFDINDSFSGTNGHRLDLTAPTGSSGYTVNLNTAPTENDMSMFIRIVAGGDSGDVAMPGWDEVADIVTTGSHHALFIATRTGSTSTEATTTEVRSSGIKAFDLVFNIKGTAQGAAPEETTVYNGGLFTSTGTVNFSSASDIGTSIPSFDYYNLTLNSAGNTFTPLAKTLRVANNLTVTAGSFDANTSHPFIKIDGALINNGTFIASGTAPLLIGGGLTNNGTFTHNNGTVQLRPNTAGIVTINGSSDTTFFNLENRVANSTVQFANARTYTFAGTLTMQGESGSPIWISSTTQSQQWLMTLSGSASIAWVNVRDSGCSGGNSIAAHRTIFNQGNNGSCWGFVSLVAPGASGGGAGGSGGVGGGGAGGGVSTATATATVSSNVVTGYVIVSGGSGYTVVPVVLVCGVDGIGSGATGTAVLENGVVVSITLGSGGGGYTSGALVTIASPSNPEGAGSCGGTGGGGSGGGGGGSP